MKKIYSMKMRTLSLSYLSKYLISIFIISSVICTSIGWATEENDEKIPQKIIRHEITGGIDSTAGFVRIHVGTRNYTQFSFTGGYSYALTRRFQIGIQGAIADTGAQLDSFGYSIFVPLTVNWGGTDLRDDFFFRLSPGVNHLNVTSMAVLVQIGKRFRLLDQFSWRPTVGVRALFGNGDPRTAIEIIPVVFSVLF